MRRIVRLAAGLLPGVVVCTLLAISPASSAEPANQPTATMPTFDSAISAVIVANGGKVPITGDQLWRSLTKLGKFAQLPVPFSSVRLDSGINTPRVVITPAGSALSQAEATEVNFDGRLYLAANMQRVVGDLRVTTVEFISWNGSRRAFDFGFIENMGTDSPRLEIVDGGKCFACHKNRGPILGVRPWSNTANDDILRFAMASSLRMSGTKLPEAGEFALPKLLGGQALPSRIDGMALVVPDAAEVDAAVRRGADIRLHRDLFRLLTRTPEGRRVLGILLVAITEPGTLDAADRNIKQAIDAAFDRSFPRFASDWVEMQKSAKLSTLLDIDPALLLIGSGVRPIPKTPFQPPIVGVPGLLNGNGSTWAAPVSTSTGRTSAASPAQLLAIAAKSARDNYVRTLVELKKYDEVRAAGSPGLISRVQPSNPHAFLRPPIVYPKRPSEVFDAPLLAKTIGLSDGDRRFLAKSLAEAAKTLPAKTSVAALAKNVFESSAFDEWIGGGPMPDREEFKDRFVEGLDEVLKKRGTVAGFGRERNVYASGPRYDSKAIEEKELAVVPTSACLRCHEIAGGRKAVRFDLIPPLAFDPFDKPGRDAWLRAADAKTKEAVLSRLIARISTDADMPPVDSPEHDRFKQKNPAAFGEAKRFLLDEYDKVRNR